VAKKSLTNAGNSNRGCTQMLCDLLDQKHDNGAAMMSLVDRYILHFARLYCNLNFHERQDIRQEVAVKLLCNGEKVRENCPRSWVYVVVRNECIDHIRRQSKQLSVFKDSDDPEAEASTHGSMPPLTESSGAVMIQEVECLHKVFDRIEQQETGKADIVIYTQYAFGWSYREISEHSNRSVDAIGQRISVLKNRLKSLMNDCC